MKKNITTHHTLLEYLESGSQGDLNYTEYVAHIAERLAEGRNTGAETNPKYLDYSKINLQRMKRWDKTGKLSDEMTSTLKNVEPQTWLVITEGWCGDSAQNIPFMKKMEEASEGRIKLVMVIRDDNPELMDAYLTNGGRSIPKLIAFNRDNEELFTWGPRPKPVQKMVTDYKQQPEPKPPYQDLQIQMQGWYNQDKGSHLQKELIELLS